MRMKGFYYYVIFNPNVSVHYTAAIIINNAHINVGANPSKLSKTINTTRKKKDKLGNLF